MSNTGKYFRFLFGLNKLNFLSKNSPNNINKLNVADLLSHILLQIYSDKAIKK